MPCDDASRHGVPIEGHDEEKERQRVDNGKDIRHMSGGAKNEAVTNIGDNKAETDSGDFIHDDTHHGASKEAVTGSSDDEDEKGNGDVIHDDSHHGAINKAENNSGDSPHVKTDVTINVSSFRASLVFIPSDFTDTTEKLDQTQDGRQ